MKILTNKRYNQLRGRMLRAEALLEGAMHYTLHIIDNFIDKEEIMRQEMILNFKEQNGFN